jgi:uncharacterized protein (TIGR02001 family)
MLTSVRGLLAATILAGSVLTAAPALAQDEAEEAAPAINISGNVALSSQYRFRGVSLSGGDIALSGGIDVVHESGFYVGTWGSSITGGSVYGELELDVYAGWTGQVAEGVTFDVGLLGYLYPTGDDPLNVDPDTDYWEPYASIATTVGPVGATVGAAYAWEQDSLGGNDNLYLYTDFTLAIPGTPVTATAHLGYTDGVLAPDFLAETAAGNPVLSAYDDSGLDWSIGLTASVYDGLSVGVSYIGVEGRSINDFTDDAVVATLSFAG